MQRTIVFISIAVANFLLSGCATTTHNLETQTKIAGVYTASAPLSEEHNKMPKIVCAEEWVACKIKPAGSIIQSEQRYKLTTFWKTSCKCSNNCGCINGLASGEGLARWCDTQYLCESRDDDFVGAISGELSNGEYVAQDDEILVTINSSLGLFNGKINSDGTYAIGTMEQLDSNEKFFGKLDKQGNYKSGALYVEDKIILANKFDGRKPLGIVLIGNSDGNFTKNKCNSDGCSRIIDEEGQHNLISELYDALSKKTVEAKLIRTVLQRFGKQALLTHPIFRAFSFLIEFLN